MSDQSLDAALEVAAQPKDTRTVLDLIETMRPEIEKSLQSEQAAAILVRHYYSAIRFNKLLRQCTGESLVAALLLSAQVRLEPGPLGHVYLVPFRNTKRDCHEVVWMLGYTGIIELGRRGGAVGLRAEVVWDNDEYVQPWSDERGLHWTLKPGEIKERRERVGCLVTWKEGVERRSERVALHMPPERVDVAIKASRNPKARELREEDWYWRKTAVRFARPWLPLATEQAQTFAQASAADGAIVHALDMDETGAAFAEIEGGEA
ncbi:MAG: recombinase RecT [Bradyrhizobium sp.]|nr:recombinase RecT [Bradyrhizobium sp.]